MRRIAFALLAAFLLSGQMLAPPAFAPGTFQDTNALTSGSASPPLSCNYTPVTSATYNVAYTGATPSASGGTAPYTFSNTGSLPTGMTISSSTGVISGTDSTDSGGATYPGIQVKVTDNVSTVANCGTSFTLTVAPAPYNGPGDVQSGWSAWYGMRAFSNALANAGATTTPVMDVRGPTSGTSCTIYLKGNGTGSLDFTTSGSGGVGNQCVSGATTFCTVTNASCAVSKLYTQVLPDTACGGASCNLVQATTANQPTLIMPGSCSYPNAASLPCLSAGALAIKLAAAYSFTPNAAVQQTISTVANRSSGTGGANIMESGFNQQGITGHAGTANEWNILSNGSGIGSAANATDATWHAANAILEAGTNLFNIDGTETTPASTTPNTTASAPTAAGGAASTTLEFAEGGWLDNFIASQTVRAAICDNQANYYGMTKGAHC